MATDTVSLLTGTGMVLAGAVPVFVLRRTREPVAPHHRPRWALFWWGALGWLLGGGVFKAVAAHAMADFLERSKGPTLWAAVGLLTGVFECGVLLLLALFVRSLRRTTWLRAVAFGVGFGAAEAFVLAIDAFLPETPTGSATRAEAFVCIAAPTLERFNAMFIHACACALVLLSVCTRQWVWFWIAFAYKTVVDGIPIEFVLDRRGIWAAEAVYVAFGIVGAVGLFKLRRVWPRETEHDRGFPAAPPTAV